CTPPILSCTTAKVAESRQADDVTDLQDLQNETQTGSERRSIGDSVRLIESPKPRLKELQRRILSSILDRIPVHPAVHGFVRGRSIVTFAVPHAGKHALLRLDLQDFFPGFPAARALALFLCGVGLSSWVLS